MPEAAPRTLADRLLGIDLRTLALFRICAGLLTTFDLVTKGAVAAELFSDAGLLPRALVPYDPFPGFYMWSGAPEWVAAVFVLAIAAAVCLTIGWHTRVATSLLWLNALSLWWRNPGLANGWDLFFIQVFFFSLFLPLAATWSLDARRSHAPTAGRVLSPASAGLCLLMPLVYFFSTFHKLGGDAGWLDGSAVAMAVSYENWSRPLGLFLRNELPFVTEAATWGTLVVEFVGPILLFSPWATRRLRIVMLLVFAGFQAGLALSIQLWLFPFASTIALLPLLPGAVWRAPARAGTSSFLPAAGPWRTLGWVVPALALAYIGFSNLERQLEWSPPRAVNRTGRLLGLNQGWAMFSGGGGEDLKLELHGVDRGGRALTIADPDRGASWPPAEALRAHYRTRTYLERVVNWRLPQEMRGLLRWTCRTWNRAHDADERLSTAELGVWIRRISLPGDPEFESRVVPLAELECATGVLRRKGR